MVSQTWGVRFVHKIAPRDTDVKEAIFSEGDFSDRNKLGAALRRQGILGKGERVAMFRVEGDRVVCFPSRTIWHSIILAAP